MYFISNCSFEPSVFYVQGADPEAETDFMTIRFAFKGCSDLYICLHSKHYYFHILLIGLNNQPNKSSMGFSNLCFNDGPDIYFWGHVGHKLQHFFFLTSPSEYSSKSAIIL